MKNPGRIRSLSILVRVSNGSGGPPLLMAGETAVPMSAVADSVYLGLYSATAGAGSLKIKASDTNVHGTGMDSVTVQF